MSIDENSIKESLKEKDDFINPEKTNAETVPRLDLVEEIFVLFELYPEIAQKHSPLYSKLKELYNSKRDLLVFQYTKDKPRLDEVQASKEVELLLFRAKQLKNENVKKEFARNIAQAESSKDRKKVLQLLKQLQDKLK